MLKTLLIATLCVATLAAPGGPKDRQRPAQVRPGSVPGIKQPSGMPRRLPNKLSTQIEDLFQRMELQQDNSQLDLTLWKDRTQAAAEGWWTALSARMSMAGKDFTVPTTVSNTMRQKITEVFTQMQNELDNGNALDFGHWQGVLTGYAQDIWATLVDSTTPEQPDYTIDRPGKGDKPSRGEKQGRGGKPARGEKPGRGDRQQSGRRDQTGRPNGRDWNSPPADLPQGMGQQLAGLFARNEQPQRGNGKWPRGHDAPGNLLTEMMQRLREVFRGLQQELESGNQIDLDVWRNDTLEVVEGLWERLGNIANRTNSKGFGKKPFFENALDRWQEQVQDMFDRMQLQLDNGEALDVKSWFQEINKGVQRWGNVFERDTKPRKPDEPRKNFPEMMPDRMTAPIQEVFDRMQTEVDNQRPLELMQYHDKIEEIAESWWDKLGKRGKGLPIVLRSQITELFTRMREEAGLTQEWDIDYWRNETLALAQEWWEQFTATDSEKISMEWIASLQEVFEQIAEYANATDTVDIDQWREAVLNRSQSWLADLDDKILKKFGFKGQKGIKMLERLGSRFPQHINHVFDRMKLESLDGLPLDIVQWQQELEDVASGLGKRIVAHKDRTDQGPERPDGRPARPQGRPDRPQGRPDRPQGRPDRPQGRPDRPQGRPDKPQGRPDRPQGKPDRPQGRPDRPQGRPDRPQGKPDRPQGRPDRPQGRPDKPQGRPDRPYQLPDKPRGRPDGPQRRPGKTERKTR